MRALQEWRRGESKEHWKRRCDGATPPSLAARRRLTGEPAATEREPRTVGADGRAAEASPAATRTTAARSPSAQAIRMTGYSSEISLQRKESNRRGRPPQLSRQAVVEAALALIDAEGLDALTMRRLGAELGV